MPQETIEAFQDHGEVALTIEEGVDEARQLFEDIEAAGVSIDDVTRVLEEEGVQKFSDSFAELLDGITRQARRAGLRLIEPGELVERIWERDPTVWTGHDEAHWLGWLDEPLRMRERLGELNEFAAGRSTRDDVVLLGMGGSSLAPEVLRRAFERDRFHVLDTTHPKAIRRLADSLDLGRTLFVVSSKSGGTLETRSHFDFFWERGAAAASSRSPTRARRSRAVARERNFAPLRGRADDRRPLLGALAVRARPGRADGDRPRRGCSTAPRRR